MWGGAGEAKEDAAAPRETPEGPFLHHGISYMQHYDCTVMREIETTGYEPSGAKRQKDPFFLSWYLICAAPSLHGHEGEG